MGVKGRAEQHKIQISTEQLVLMTPQKKESSDQTFTVSVVNKRSINLWKKLVGYLPVKIYARITTKITAPLQGPSKKNEWYQGCDLNQYFVNVKDNITLKMEMKG